MNKNETVIPDGYTFDEWDRMPHIDRIQALYKYSKCINSSTKLDAVKNEIEYYRNIQWQINKLVRI